MEIGDRVVIDTKGRLGWADGKTGTIVAFCERVDFPLEDLNSRYMYQVRADDMNLKTPPYGLIAVLENEVQPETAVYMDIQKDDPVNHPNHYTDGKYECIDYIESSGYFMNGYLFNAVKYISRAGKKDPNKYEEDLRKAIWYLKRNDERKQKQNQNQLPSISTEDYIRDKGLEDTLPGIALELIADKNYKLAVKVLEMELKTHEEHPLK